MFSSIVSIPLRNKHDRRKRDRDEKTERRLSTLLLLLFNFPCSLFKFNDLPRVNRQFVTPLNSLRKRRRRRRRKKSIISRETMQELMSFNVALETEKKKKNRKKEGRASASKKIHNNTHKYIREHEKKRVQTDRYVQQQRTFRLLPFFEIQLRGRKITNK